MARNGLKSVFRTECGEAKSLNGFTLERWDKVQARYRMLIFGKVAVTSSTDDAGKVPEAKDRKGKRGVSRAKIQEVEAKDGKLGLIEVMRHRVRYFTQGVALGRVEFVEAVFAENRGAFGKNRKDGARKMRGGLGRMLGELRTLRDLRG